MRGKWIGFLAVLMLLASAAFVLGAEETQKIGIEVTTINGSIYGDEVATYSIKVTNLLSVREHFRVSLSEDLEWIFMTDPLNYKLSGIDLEPGQSATFLATLTPNPTSMIANKQYSFILTVKGANTGLYATDIVKVGYGPQFVGGRQYPAVVTFEVEMEKRVDPRKGIEARLFLKNRNYLNITRLDIFFNSSLFDEYVLGSLGPREEKTIILTKDLDPLQAPKLDTLTVRIAYQGKTLDTKNVQFEIIPYSQFEEQRTVNKVSFLKTITTLSYRNNGNVEKTETVKYQMPFLQTLFAHSDHKARLVSEGGKTYLGWQLKLAANETQPIKVTVDYLPLLILVVLIILVILVYQLTKSPIAIQKSAVLLAQREGGIAGIKIVLKMKNISKKAIHDLEVVDSFPNIVEIDKNFEMGSIPPTKIVDHGARGILVKWKLGELEPGEERIVSYKAKTRLTILGNLTLPAAVLRFIVNYKEKIHYSNRVRMQL